MTFRTTLLAVALAALGAGCSSSADSLASGGPPPDYTDPKAGFDDAAIAELHAKGFDKYVGKFAPDIVSQTETLTFYTWNPNPAGPICMKGDPFRASVRLGSTDDLIIYLQGGGACWTGTCAATEKASGAPTTLGWTDGNVELNPLGTMNLIFLGYCDGSVFSGDGDVPDPPHGDATGTRRHHGLANLSAALDVAKGRFPGPRRIVLAGSSAGGYGTIMATAVVRFLWPKTDLFVINDAGIGLTNPDKPQMYDTIVKEWNLADRLPTSCTSCGNRQFTPFIGWALEHDPTLRVGAFSSYEDDTIGGGFLDMAGPEFKALLLKETDPVHAAFPDRFERFFIEGSVHTAMIGGYYDLKVDGVTLPEWTRRLIASEPSWPDLLENGGK